MLTQQEKMSKNDVEQCFSTFKIGVYTIYDTVLKQFDIPIAIPVTKLYDYMAMLVNDVGSKYYGHESDFVLNKVGDFNQDTGEVENHFVEKVALLDSYIDRNQRNLQTVIKTLNFLPQGYFKMPMEQKQAIQEKIDCAITEYVANYVLPDLDVSKFDTKKIQDIYRRYDCYEHLLKVDRDNKISKDYDFDSGVGKPFYNDET